jgi:3'-phosphoadenosine 5'-phosphosulfate sulfotransferase (PAPS reductase)/FAD synthetase
LARSLESTQASIEAALGAGARRAAVAFSGGKDSCAVLDLAVRAFERDAWLREQGLEEDRYQDGTKLPRAAGEGV